MFLFDNLRLAIGSVLKKIREEKKEVDKNRYKQKSVAEVIGSSSSYISDIEQGKQYPYFIQFRKIVEGGLNCNVAQVLEEIAQEYGRREG